MRAAPRVERTVGDLDRGDGLRAVGKLRPDAENGEQPLGRRRQCRGAGVSLAALRRLGIDQRDAKALWRRSGQGKRQRHADKAAAGDDHVVALCLGHRALHQVRRRSNRNPSFRAVERGSGSACRTGKGRRHEPRAGTAALHSRHRDARGESVSRREPAGRLAARVRRAGDRPGAGRRLSHRRTAASRIRCTPISCAPAIPRCRSSTRSTASATAAASRPAAWSRSSTARRSSPWRPRSTSRRRGLQHQMKMPDVPPPESLPSEAELKELLFDRLPPQVKAYWERERPIEIRPVDLSRYLAPEKRAATQQMWIRATGDARRRSRLAPMRARLCLGFHPARHRADRPWPLRVRSDA